MDVSAGAASAAVIKILLGVALCFFGTRSLKLTAVAVGFALGAALAEALGASVTIALLVGVAGAIVGLLAVSFVVRWTVFVVGALAGGTVAASLYRHFTPGEGSALLVVIVVGAVALITGFVADRFRDRLLAAITALAGASLILTGLGELFPSALGFLDDPDEPAQSLLTAVIWLVLSAAGWSYQRRWQLSQAATK